MGESGQPATQGQRAQGQAFDCPNSGLTVPLLLLKHGPFAARDLCNRAQSVALAPGRNKPCCVTDQSQTGLKLNMRPTKWAA